MHGPRDETNSAVRDVGRGVTARGEHDEQGDVGVVDAAEHTQLEPQECPVSLEEAHSDEGGVETVGEFVDVGNVAGNGDPCEKDILDVMRADLRLCASFSLARFTRFTMSLIVCAALPIEASVAVSELFVSESVLSPGVAWPRRLSWSWSRRRGYLQIRCTGFIR